MIWLLSPDILTRLLERADSEREAIVRLLDQPGKRFLLTDAVFVVAVGQITADPLFDKESLCQSLVTLLGIDSLSGNISLLTRAVRLYARTSMEFSAAYLAAQALESNLPILSYDKALDRIPGLKREVPGKKG